MAIDRRRLITAGAVLGAVVAGHRLLHAQQPKERTIQVVARKFVFLPNEITIRQGEPVVLELTAPEVVMGLSIPDLKARIDIVPGQVARLPLRPEKAGRFDFVCDIFCGDGHEGMGGTLIVVG